MYFISEKRINSNIVLIINNENIDVGLVAVDVLRAVIIVNDNDYVGIGDGCGEAESATLPFGHLR